MKRRTGRILFATAVAAMAALAPAGTANAGLLSQSAGPCPSYPMSQPFSKWLDPMSYTLAPGGVVRVGLRPDASPAAPRSSPATSPRTCTARATRTRC